MKHQYYGYVVYTDGECMCHCKGTMDEVKDSQNEVAARAGDLVRYFVIKPEDVR